MRKFVLVAAILTTILLGGNTPSPVQSTAFQQELDHLRQRGLAYRFLDENTIEIKEEWSGFTRIKALEQPSTSLIREWASKQGIPTLEIDPAIIDTSLYVGWYTYWTTVPVSNSFGFKLAVGDLDRNGQTEVYGGYKFYHPIEDVLARIYELDSLGQVTLRHTFQPYPGLSEKIIDADRDGFMEIQYIYADTIRDFEQSTGGSLPIIPNFAFQYLQAGSGGYSPSYIGLLDLDSTTDYLYKTTWRDSLDTTLVHIGTAVAEFNLALNNFQRVWARDHYEQDTIGDYIGGYSVDDFDGDGRKEFVLSFYQGNILVFENAGDNNYQRVWRDSLPFVNLIYHVSGDVDGDGKPEFFVGATMFNGNWTIVYEADSNNHYTPTFLFHFLSGGTGDEPTYLTSDMDGDGRLELVLLSGRHLYALKGNGNNSYRLWYYKREDRKDALAVYDVNNDGREDLIISKQTAVDSLGRVRYYADIYTATSLVGVGESGDSPMTFELFQNYPNPFNGTTKIRYSISRAEYVSLNIYDLLGSKVAVLAERQESPGTHEVSWDATTVASGVYFYRLSIANSTLTRKLLLIR